MHISVNPSKGLLSVILVALISVGYGQEVAPSAAKDDGFDIKKSSFLLPQALPSGKYYHGISVNYVLVPKDWAHDFVNAPMFGYSAKYTLPAGFNLQANVWTLFVSTRANFGPSWNHSFGNFHVGAGYQVAFNLGYLGQFGFHTVLTGWEQQPSITWGYSFKKSAVVMRADMYYTTALYISEGGNTITYPDGYLNGYSLTASFEERLWKNRLMSFGVKLNYLRYHILAWPALPVNGYRYLVPEFQIGLKF
jgi:hypothetical protein